MTNPDPREQAQEITRKPEPAVSGKTAFLAWICALSGVAGGSLWALSPLGARLSAEVLRAPEFFWRLFPSAPLAMLLGLAGMYLYSRRDPEVSSALRKAGFASAVVGGLLVIAGDIALFHLGLDDVFIMSAPAYRMLRVGLFVFAAGTLLFAFLLARGRALPLAGTLPLVLGAFFGLVSVVRDLGQFGAAMWVAFGVGFAWCSLVIVWVGVFSFLRSRRLARQSAPADG